MFATIAYAPNWASGHLTDSTHHYGPQNIQDWRDFVSAVALHFGDRVKYFGLWNEPNDTSNVLIGDDGTGTYYRALAYAGRDAIKDVDPNLMVVGPDVSVNGGELLQRMLSWDRQVFDVLSFHYYADGHHGTFASFVFDNFVNYHYIYPNLPIWVTEIGADPCHSDQNAGQTQTSFYSNVLPSFEVYRSAGWLSKFFAYHLASDACSASTFDFGLVFPYAGAVNGYARRQGYLLYQQWLTQHR